VEMITLVGLAVVEAVGFAVPGLPLPIAPLARDPRPLHQRCPREASPLVVRVPVAFSSSSRILCLAHFAVCATTSPAVIWGGFGNKGATCCPTNSPALRFDLREQCQPLQACGVRGVGGYPSQSLGEDAAFDAAFSALPGVDPLRGDKELTRSEWFFIYRWGLARCTFRAELRRTSIGKLASCRSWKGASTCLLIGGGTT
jgi:hypothetical protein